MLTQVTTRYLVNDACVLLGKPLVYGRSLYCRLY
jgi:molybdopterin/thiamine biosynthesis adenylyltransferase